MAQLTSYFENGTYDGGATSKELGLQGNFDEIWYPVLQTTFEEMNTLEGLYVKKNISNGTSLKVPVIDEGSVSFTKTGGTIPEEDIQHGSVNILINDALTGSVSLYDDDKAAINYSFIETKVKNVAKQMAKFHTREIAANLLNAARGIRNSGDVNVGVVTNANPAIEIAGWSGLTPAEKGVALATSLFKAAETLDLKDVKEDGRYFICNPSTYYLLFNNLDAINKLYGTSGSYADGKILRIAGIDIIKSNAYGQNPTDKNGDYFTNVDYGTEGTDLSMGVVTTNEAVAQVELLSMKVEQFRKPAQRKTVWYMSKVVGYGILRNDVAVEIKQAV